MNGDNVISFPERTAAPVSAKKRASVVLQQRFLARQGVTKEVYEHLARGVNSSVELLRQQVGERSGALQRAFGANFLKQKRRFSLREGEAAATICQNPGNWLQVLTGLARELERDPDTFILEIFSGSALLPVRSSADYRVDSWYGDFERLLEAMTASLASKADIANATRYLFDSALILEAGELLEVEHQDEDPFIDPRLTYASEVLQQMPHVLGINFRNDYLPEVALTDERVEHLVAQMRSYEDLPDEGSLVPHTGTRFGVALAVDATTEQPTLAMFEWRVGSLLVSDADGKPLLEKALTENWPTLLSNEGCLDDELRPGWARFSFLGSQEFQKLATMQIIYPDVWADPDDHDFWDPGGYVDKSVDYPTNAPCRTVAASIERNLLYASTAGESAQRLDNILLGQGVEIERLIALHRSKQKATIEAAFSYLLSEWQAPPQDSI